MIINPYRYASGPTVLLRDTFTGAAGDLEAHSPEVGGAWAEGGAASGATFDIDGAGFCANNGSPDGRAVAVVECSAADVQIDIVDGGDLAAKSAGACVNYAGTSQFWACVVSGGSSFILEYNTGVTTRASGAGATTTGEVLRVVASGDTLTMYVDGVETTSYTGSPRLHKTATKHGIRVVGTGGTPIDSIEVTE